MERLTERVGDEWIARKERLNGKIMGNKTCMKRLAEYENTGLAPEQIQKIDKLFLEKCEEVDRLKSELREVIDNIIEVLTEDAAMCNGLVMENCKLEYNSGRRDYADSVIKLLKGVVV